MPDSTGPVIYLFAKAPVPGQVKTRMQPHLSEAESADLALRMMTISMSKVAGSWPGPRVMAAAPDKSHPAFARLCSEYGFDLVDQGDGDLGERMLRVLEQGIDTRGFAVVMGCDVPHIDERIIGDAYRDAVAGNPFVGAAVDGGFYVLGLGKFPDGIFKGITWGGSQVLEKLLGNLEEPAFGLARYPVLRDIDTWPDLVWLAERDKSFSQLVS